MRYWRLNTGHWRLTTGQALQGAFSEHLQLLERAGELVAPSSPYQLSFALVRTAAQLATCSALIIPGGESTTMALVAERSGLLEPLREFVKVARRPTWGTCAGMILLAESANRTKHGGQELIGGLDVRISRNHFGRQAESFTVPLHLPFLRRDGGADRDGPEAPFLAVFIRAPVVEALLPKTHPRGGGEQVHAPAKLPAGEVERLFAGGGRVHVLAQLLRRGSLPRTEAAAEVDGERLCGGAGCDAPVVAVRQGNVVGTSFHPELTGDVRMHRWWLERVVEDLQRRELLGGQL